MLNRFSYCCERVCTISDISDIVNPMLHKILLTLYSTIVKIPETYLITKTTILLGGQSIV